ncbi:MAG: GTP-binding protein [Planctomycetes bacterium]|nr:GTP-binding protein [Planctomycetota bacterium]
MDEKELRRIIEEADEDGRTELSLLGEGIKSLPAEIGKLTKLTKLWLSSYHLTSVPKELGQLTNLRELFLDGSQLTSVPKELGQLTNLTRLFLRYNQLASVPKELGQLTNLRELFLDRNQLTSVPKELGQLTNLTTLFLRENQLTSIPKELGQLTNLTRLDLGENQLTSVPKELGQLTNLRELTLGGNQLTSVQMELGQLTDLRELTLDGNQLTSVQMELGQLTNLTFLYLSGNQLTSVPKEIVDWGMEISWEGKFDKGGGIVLDGNPLESPPVEVVKRGTKAVREWFEALEEEGERRLNEVKVLMVGYGGAGKTSLVRKVRTGKFNKKEVKTHGVRINDWKIKVGGDDITVHFWDYGGQGIMQATHRVFFSHRSLYVLVIDARQESDPEEWLKNIESLGGKSPVLVVINKTDEHAFGLNEPELERKYPNIKGFYHISCKSGDGIELFKKGLKEYVAQVEMIGINWPRRWAEVRERLGRLRSDYITYSRYEEICREEKVNKKERQKELIGILHELGVMLHFPDRHLRGMGVLNPEWVTSGIYKIINSEEVKKHEGKVPRDRLGHIFNVERLPDEGGKGGRKHRRYSEEEQGHIVDLMNKFELCYELDDWGILVPDVLAEKEPTEGLPKGADLRFYFEYDFMPALVMPRFMVKSGGDLDTEKCWRTGAVLKNETFGSVAVIRQDKHRKRIYIEVRGGQARDYFATIRQTILKINDSFEKLDVMEWVPLPGEEDRAVKYLDLIGHEISGRNEKFVGELTKGYSVAELLGGIESRDETLDTVLAMFASMEKRIGNKVEGARDAILGHLSELKALSQRYFTYAYNRDQRLDESHCPNVFAVMPKDGQGWLKNLLGQKMVMQLYCQAPGQWHPAVEGAKGKGGRYEIKRPGEFLGNMGPYILKLAKVIKYAGPVAGAAVGGVIGAAALAGQIKLMEELAKKLADRDYMEAELFERTGAGGKAERLEGMELRALRKLLDEVDPNQEWGGLKKVLTPEGHFLWLCKEHAEEYKK